MYMWFDFILSIIFLLLLTYIFANIQSYTDEDNKK